MDWRLKVALDILKKAGKLRSNELVRRLMDQGPMARDTARKVINEGVKQHKIFREDVTIKTNEQAVYYTVYPDINKDEKFRLGQIEKLLKDFDERFSVYEEKFSNLSIEKKAKGVEAFSLYLIMLNLATKSLLEAFDKKRNWKTLQNEVYSRNDSLTKLVISCPKKEQVVIGRHALEGKLLYLDNNAREFLDEIIDQIK